jgi:hypothetical protein
MIMVYILIAFSLQIYTKMIRLVKIDTIQVFMAILFFSFSLKWSNLSFSILLFYLWLKILFFIILNFYLIRENRLYPLLLFVKIFGLINGLNWNISIPICLKWYFFSHTMLWFFTKLRFSEILFKILFLFVRLHFFYLTFSLAFR